MPWLLLLASTVIPLPGLGGPYPPSRFLAILGFGAACGTLPFRIAPLLGRTHIIILISWTLLLAARMFTSCVKLGYGYDLAHILNILENTCQGRFLYSDYLEGSILSYHLYLTLGLLAPLYQIGRSALLLQCVQLLLMATGAWLLASGAERRFGPFAGVGSLLLLLMHPFYQGQSLHEFDPGVIGFFGASLALYGYGASRTVICCAGIMMALLSKEHFAPGAILCGMMLSTDRRTRRRGTAMAILGFSTLIVYYGWTFLTSQGEGLLLQASIRLKNTGGSTGILHNLVAPNRIGYILHMLIPGGLLALAGWAWLVPALPELFLNVLSTFPMFRSTGHYAVLTLPFFAWAVASGIARFSAQGANTFPLKYVVSTSLAAALLSNLGPLSHSIAFYDFLQSDGYGEAEAVRTFVSGFPGGTVAVLGSHRTLTLLADREPAIELPYRDMSPILSMKDLMLFDLTKPRPPPGYFFIAGRPGMSLYRRDTTMDSGDPQ